MVCILDYSVSTDDDLFAVSPEPRSTQPVQPALPGPTPRQLRSAVLPLQTSLPRCLLLLSAVAPAWPLVPPQLLTSETGRSPGSSFIFVATTSHSNLQHVRRICLLYFILPVAGAMTSALIVALPSVAKSHDKTSPTHVSMGVFTNSNPRLKKQAQFTRIISGLETPRPHRLHLHEALLLPEKSESRTIAPVNQRLI